MTNSQKKNALKAYKNAQKICIPQERMDYFKRVIIQQQITVWKLDTFA